MRGGRPTRKHTTASTIGDIISRKRATIGWSRAELARQAGLSLNTLMKIEQGRTVDPGVLKVALLSRALNIGIDDLVAPVLRATEQELFPQMTNGIVSFGYEGRTIDDAVKSLQRAGVKTVVDVRLNAISRKPGFSKTRLREALASAGIGYRHLRALGNPKENREPFWAGRIEEGQEFFRSVLQNDAAVDSLREIGDLAAEQVVAVLCFEADHERCHRRVVIEQVSDASPVPVTTSRA